MAASTPRMHGATHRPGGPDPIPGGGDGDGIQFDVNPQEGGALHVDALTGPIRLEVAGPGGSSWRNDGTGLMELRQTGGPAAPAVGFLISNTGDGGLDLNNAGDGVLRIRSTGSDAVDSAISTSIETPGGDLQLYAQDGNIRLKALPTVDPAVVGAIWNDHGTVVFSGSTAGGGGGAPSGPAGGVLAGTYPNPTFAADMATQTELDTGLGKKVDRDAVEAATNRLVQVKLAAGDTQPAFKIQGDGKMLWGPGGTTAPDSTLYRNSVSVLKTDGQFYTTSYLAAFQGTASQVTLEPAKISFGSTGDAFIFRSSAGVLGISTPSLGTREILIGPADSAAAGYRSLRVVN